MNTALETLLRTFMKNKLLLLATLLAFNSALADTYNLSIDEKKVNIMWDSNFGLGDEESGFTEQFKLNANQKRGMQTYDTHVFHAQDIETGEVLATQIINEDVKHYVFCPK